MPDIRMRTAGTAEVDELVVAVPDRLGGREPPARAERGGVRAAGRRPVDSREAADGGHQTVERFWDDPDPSLEQDLDLAEWP